MKQLGCFGLLAGALTGLLIVILLVLLLQPTPPPPANQPPAIAPDISVFLSERSLSRMATETLQRPTVVDFNQNGRMTVSTHTQLGRLKPLVHIGLLIEMQGTDVASRIEWVRFGFLSIPPGLLPQSIVEASAQVGQIIKEQTPPDFMLVGLTTTPTGINFQLKWIGQ